MNTSKPSACLWTGGKDCCLALHRAVAEGRDIRCLVTFAPPRPRFLAHPIAVMQAQAKAMGIEHRVIHLQPPLEQAYRDAIRQLAAEGIATLITGDIDLVDGLPNWVAKCCEGTGVTTHMPLWKQDRRKLMEELAAGGFEVVLSLVKRPWLDESFAGRRIDKALLAELEAIRAGGTRGGCGRAAASPCGIMTTGTGTLLRPNRSEAQIRTDGGLRSEPVPLDLCGENGEYHTVVLDAPMFKQRVTVEYDKAAKDEMTYLNIRKVSLTERQ